MIRGLQSSFHQSTLKEEQNFFFGTTGILQGTRQFVQERGTFELREVQVVEVFYKSFIRKFSRCQQICSSEGDIRVKEVRVMETLLYGFWKNPIPVEVLTNGKTQVYTLFGIDHHIAFRFFQMLVFLVYLSSLVPGSKGEAPVKRLERK